jgi:hypothetical protein
MGLALSFEPGEDFYINNARFVIISVQSPTAFTIRRESDGAQFALIDNGSSTEIAPQVMARVSLRGQYDLARLDLSAPHAIKILTGKNYRANFRPPP